MKSIKEKKEEKIVLGFKVGDRVINIDSTAFNFKKLGTIIGFHSIGEVAFMKYDDGTYGTTTDSNDYLKISDFKLK